ncbi:methyltransferase [Candidatus Woesearchaeota archaeon]|nr:methyltransferase [Candidatus Woesearchaeota archaeon]
MYEPDEDSFLLVKQVKKLAKDKKVLDMGTGFGILAETALESGAKDVLAVDIDEEVIEFVKSKGIKVKTSDLFSNIDEKFDLIIFNPPYLPEDELEDFEIRNVTTGGKEGYEIIERFLIDAKKYLNKNGEILIVFSSLTNKEKVDSILNENKYKFKCLETKKMFFEELYVYLIKMH